MQDPQARGAGGGELDVVVADGRRHDDGVDVGDVRRVVAHVDAGTAVAQRLQRGAVGGVGAADRKPRASINRATADIPAPPMAMRCTRPSSSRGGTGAVKS